MTLKEHATYGAAVSAALYPVLGAKVAFFYIPSVLIDADHYLDYLYFSKFRDWSVKQMFRFHGVLYKFVRLNREILALEAFHTAEFLLAILGVGLYFRSDAVLLMFAGLMFHMVLDLIRMAQWKRIDVRALSFVEYAVRKRRMIKQGTHPEAIFFEVYDQVKESEETPVSMPEGAPVLE